MPSVARLLWELQYRYPQPGFLPTYVVFQKIFPKNSPGKDEGHINRTDVQCTGGEKNRERRWSLSHLGGSLLPAWYHGGKRGQWRLEEGWEWHQPPRLPLCWRSICDNSSYYCLLSKVSNLCWKLSPNICSYTCLLSYFATVSPQHRQATQQHRNVCHSPADSSRFFLILPICFTHQGSFEEQKWLACNAGLCHISGSFHWTILSKYKNLRVWCKCGKVRWWST